MAKEKTVKMTFPRDMYYSDQNVPIYPAHTVVSVPESKMHRWMKRGGVLVEDAAELISDEVESAPVARSSRTYKNK